MPPGEAGWLGATPLPMEPGNELAAQVPPAPGGVWPSAIPDPLVSMLQAQHNEVMQLLQGWMRSQESQQQANQTALGASAPRVSGRLNMPLTTSEEWGGSGGTPGKINSETFVARRQTPDKFNSETFVARRQTPDLRQGLDADAWNRCAKTDRHDERQCAGIPLGIFEKTEPADALVQSPSSSSPKRKKSMSVMLSTAPQPQKQRSRIQRVVQHKLFDVIFGVVVIANCLLVGYSVDAGGTAKSSLDICQHIFNAIFLVELLLRLSADGPRAYFCASRARMWNLLDLLLVLSGIFETLTPIVDSSTSAPDLNHMRLLRIVRLMRLARIVRFVLALQILLHSIVSTLKSMTWVAFLVCLVVYFFGIVFAQAIGDTEDSLVAWVHWGTLPRAMYTLFQVMTNGVDWGEVVQPLADVHWALVCVFVFFVIFVFFALMNVITGIFCTAAMEGVQQERDFVVTELLANKKMYVEKTHDLFSAMFAQIDADGSGNVSLEEFEEHIMDDVVQAYFAVLELDTSDAYTLFKLLDVDGSDGIDAEEFVDGCLKLKGAARSIDLIRLSTEMRHMAKQLSRFVATANAHLVAIRKSL